MTTQQELTEQQVDALSKLKLSFENYVTAPSIIHFDKNMTALILTDTLFFAGVIPERFTTEQQAQEWLIAKLRWVSIKYEYHF